MENLVFGLLLILFVIGILYIFLDGLSPRNDEKFKNIFNNLEDFNADEIHLSVISINNPSLTDNLMFIPAAGFDTSNKKIVFINSWKDDIEREIKSTVKKQPLEAKDNFNWICDECNEENEPIYDVCWNCSTESEIAKKKYQEFSKEEVKKEKKEEEELIQKTVKIYSFNDIMESEIVVDGNTIVKTSTTSTIGRAVVGGVLTGGVGAVIGGVTGKKSHNEMVNNIDLKICVNDSSNPFYKIRFLDTECKKGDFLYKTAYQNAERWHGIISTFIKQSELKEIKNESASSDVNDLLKLKELLDAGLLTNEEFVEQKNKILKQ